MSSFPLTLDQLYDDLASIEASGIDTVLLTQLVKEVEGDKEDHPNENTEIADLITRISKLSPKELVNENNRVALNCASAKEKLHEAVYHSGLVFMRISEWMNKTQSDFEGMLETLQTIGDAHDAAIAVATSNPSSGKQQDE